MFALISILFCGVGTGYLLRKIAILQRNNVWILYTIYALLFLLGISVGSNKSIMNNLGTLGVEALLIAVAGTMGSVIAAGIVYHLFFKRKDHRK